MKEIEELQSVEDRDKETLHCLGAEFVINDVKFPPPTTGVLSLLEMIDSPFIIGVENFEDIKMNHINEALYLLHNRERAVSIVAQRKQFENAAKKNPEFLERYLKSDVYRAWVEEVYSFVTTLGVFDYAKVIVQIQEYISICFNALDMLPDNKKGGVKKKETLMQNG